MAKYLIILTLCILGASLSKAGMSKEEMLKAFMGVAEPCQAETGASQSDIDDMIAKKPAAGKEGKCIRACVLQKFGAMDADGNLVKETAYEHSKKILGDDPAIMKKAVEVIDDCATKVAPGDKCESAENYDVCFRAAAKANGVEDLF